MAIVLPEGLREALAWYHFIPRLSQAGDRWVREFRAARSFELCMELEHAVALARANNTGESIAVLTDVARQLHSQRRARSRAHHLVLRRLYLAVLANVRYVQKKYVEAARLLERAAAAETHAIEQAAFLQTMASSRCEFCLHHARIARNRYRWAEMADWLEQGRAMIRNERALASLSCGRALFFRDLDAIYLSIEPRSVDEEEALRRLTDAAGRQLEFETVARRIEVLGTVIIPSD